MDGQNENRVLTLGEKRVGITFNPGGHEAVNEIKRITADLIDKMEAFKRENGGANPEAARCAAEAQTCYEGAAMWAVKAVTKPL